MTSVWPILRSWKTELLGVLFFLWMVVCFYIILTDTPTDIKIRAACDRYVSQLMHSDDLVEVTRASAMIDKINCGVRKRLP